MFGRSKKTPLDPTPTYKDCTNTYARYKTNNDSDGAKLTFSCPRFSLFEYNSTESRSRVANLEAARREIGILTAGECVSCSFRGQPMAMSASVSVDQDSRIIESVVWTPVKEGMDSTA